MVLSAKPSPAARRDEEVAAARSCLVRLHPRPEASHRLYCFGWSGAGPAVFERWSRELPDEVELVAVQLPGRAGRRSEPLQTRLGPIARQVAAAIRAEQADGAAFYGHSLGALLAYEVALRLRGSGFGIETLICSGSRGPTCAPPQPLHRLNDATLVRRLVALGGIPAHRTHDQQFIRRVLPVIRADLMACETYEASRDGRLDCQVVAWAGGEDWYAPASITRRWAEIARRPERAVHRVFPGGHFFVRDVAVGRLLAELRWPQCAPDWTGAAAESETAA